jgi:hypothetical protein
MFIFLGVTVKFRLNTLLLLTVVTGTVLVLGFEDADAQPWRDQIGWNDLVAENGGVLPSDGAGVNVAIVESADANGNYLPALNSGEFAGKTITAASGNTGGNGHSSGVAFRLLGNTMGVASGVTDLTVYEASDYLGRVLQFNTGLDPLADSFDVTNHSYIANGNPVAVVANILARFDYVIDRDDTFAAVGANNNSNNSTPQLLAPSFNAVTVGRADGFHSRGQTSVYGIGRFKPDIVAPQGTTSNATPLVAGAGALLKQAGAGTNAANNQVIKAMLFAGATKGEFASWDRTTTRPIDEVYGFGELNILNSYHIFEGGEFNGSTVDPTTDIGVGGYDLGQFNGTDDLFYEFTVLSNGFVSAALNWNVDVVDNDTSGAFDPSVSLANLDLELYDSTGTFLGTLIDSSISTDYNVEHIYMTGLAAGNYTFRISGDQATDFGFAWRVAPTGAVLLDRGVTYGGSSYPDSEFAPDKFPLFSGQTATFANYTSYSRGLNRVAFDIEGLGSPTLSNGDFEFRVGNSDDPSTWTLLTSTSTIPLPTISVGTPVAGVSQVLLTWPDNAIENAWLQVVVLDTANTNLGSSETFYFGNAIGETGNDPTDALVNLLDVGQTRSNQTGFSGALIDNAFDFDRDGRVNLIDVGLCRTNQSGFTPLQLISLPANRSEGGGESGGNKNQDSIDQNLVMPSINFQPLRTRTKSRGMRR